MIFSETHWCGCRWRELPTLYERSARECHVRKTDENSFVFSRRDKSRISLCYRPSFAFGKSVYSYFLLIQNKNPLFFRNLNVIIFVFLFFINRFSLHFMFLFEIVSLYLSFCFCFAFSINSIFNKTKRNVNY